MLKSVTVATAFGVALLAGSAAGADAKERNACALKGSHTVLATKFARVYRVRNRGYGGWTYYGCVYSRNRRIHLGEGGGDSDTQISKLTVAGGFVAMAAEITFSTGFAQDVWVVDLRGRDRGARVYPTGELTQEQAYPRGPLGGVRRGVGPATDIELRANGAVAWIARDEFAGAPDAFEVRRSAGDTSVLLEEGTGIEPESLAASRTTLYWMRAGQPRSAPF